jgi:hypothetical protein
MPLLARAVFPTIKYFQHLIIQRWNNIGNSYDGMRLSPE